jgi:hypothetical protein
MRDAECSTLFLRLDVHSRSMPPAYGPRDFKAETRWTARCYSARFVDVCFEVENIDDAGDGQGTAGVKVNVALTVLAGTTLGYDASVGATLTVPGAVTVTAGQTIQAGTIAD